MKKYDIPQIEILHFITEIYVASSVEPQGSYINEANKLEAALHSAEYEKRMENFSALLAYEQ